MTEKQDGGDAESGDNGRGERIAKVIARAGVCSRRDAERWIEDGRVTLNGKVLTTPAVTVTESDTITVDGNPLATRERTRLWLFHKPRGLVTTNRDPEGRPTVFEALPRDMPRVLSIGRLDINTEGLLLLTNDGGLARVLELPSTGWLRRYRVRAFGTIEQPQLDALQQGVTIEGMIYGGVEATLDRKQGQNVWLTVGLREGKNREVKRVLEHLGLSVNRLIRVSYGPFQLNDLPEGAVDEVRGRVLRDQLGEKLAEAADADFEAPIRQGKAGERPEGAPRQAVDGSRGAARSTRGRRETPEADGDRDGGRGNAQRSPRGRGGDEVPEKRRGRHAPGLRFAPETADDGAANRRGVRRAGAERPVTGRSDRPDFGGPGARRGSGGNSEREPERRESRQWDAPRRDTPRRETEDNGNRPRRPDRSDTAGRAGSNRRTEENGPASQRANRFGGERPETSGRGATRPGATKTAAARPRFGRNRDDAAEGETPRRAAPRGPRGGLVRDESRGNGPRNAPRGGSRSESPRGAGQRSNPRNGAEDGPRGGPGGDRPSRGGGGDRPLRGGPGGDRPPRGGPNGDRPPRGGGGGGGKTRGGRPGNADRRRPS
ncbi:pseudouridine synthase [Faunimonas pinastri]|nr:pseudouridine synthase [Faunimonas pinastri]